MNRLIKALLLLVIMLIPMMTAPISLAQDGEYIKDIKIVSGDSEDDVIQSLQEAGYTPVMKNIADERPELASEYVYAGYRTTTDPDESIEGREASNTGSVFGDAGLMIGGIGMVLGVVIGMISMRIRPKGGKTDE